jgi:hypothetical protein
LAPRGKGKGNLTVLPLNKFLRSANSSYDSRFAQQNLAFFAPRTRMDSGSARNVIRTSTISSLPQFPIRRHVQDGLKVDRSAERQSIAGHKADAKLDVAAMQTEN